jgi:hypothetical protein
MSMMLAAIISAVPIISSRQGFADRFAVSRGNRGRRSQDFKAGRDWSGERSLAKR